MKTLIASVLILNVFFCQAQEQKAVKTYFVKGNGFSTVFKEKKLEKVDSADYTRTVGLDKNNESLYDVTEYYLDKSIRRIGNSLTNDFTPKYSGNVISYFENGNKASEELFVTGQRKGVSTYYFSNKQIRKVVRYDSDKTGTIEKVSVLNDSLGNHFLDEAGTGSFKITDEAGDLVEGAYTNGLKDKTWKTVNIKKRETYFDEYDGGKYIQGKTIDASGKTTKYDKLEALPTFKGGLSALGSFLSSNLRYPDEARDNNIQGRVFLQFVIEKDGTLVEAKVVRGIGSGCDEEALRVINKSPRWNPGTQRGRPVRVSYVLPIFFQLSTSNSKK